MHRDFVSIILFQLCDPKFGLFQGNLFWVGHHPQSSFERKTNPITIQLYMVLKQPIKNNSKNCWYYLIYIDADVISFVVTGKGKTNPKRWQK